MDFACGMRYIAYKHHQLVIGHARHTTKPVYNMTEEKDMVLSCNPDSENSNRPPFCRCGNLRFHGHGNYWRIVAQVLVQRFICLACKVTVSMIPSSCVPYKHHPVSVINPTLDGMILQGQSGRYYECKLALGIDGSTAYRWRQEFYQNSSILATEGSQRLGLQPLSGTGQSTYQKFKAHFSHFKDQFFTPFQVLLCSNSPPIGIFRSFSF